MDGAPVDEHVKSEVGYSMTVTTFDVMLERKWRAAMREAERLTGRTLLTTTYTALFDAVEGAAPIYLPRGPARSVTSLKTFDDDDTATTVSSSNYRLEGIGNPATDFVEYPMLVSVGSGWSVERTRAAAEVVYVCGYGAIADVPGEIFEAVLRRTVDLWRFRSSIGSEEAQEAAATWEELLSRYIPVVPHAKPQAAYAR